MNQAFLIDRASTFSTYVYEDNQIIIPDSATITIRKPNTTVELITAQAMTVEADGELTFALTAGNNDTADMSYQATVSYVVGSVTEDVIVYYDIVRSKLRQVITNDDIRRELPSIKGKEWKALGTVISGSTTTIVDLNLSHYEDDYFTGGIATNLTNNETRKITDFASSTGTVTTDTFTTTNGANEKYVLQRAFTDEIDNAWEKLISMLRESGKFHNLILDSQDLRQVHILLTCAGIARGFSNDQDEYWFAREEKYEKQFQERYKSLNLKYDASDDGVTSSGEELDKIHNARTRRT
jgi:hypothetical protein